MLYTWYQKKKKKFMKILASNVHKTAPKNLFSENLEISCQTETFFYSIPCYFITS